MNFLGVDVGTGGSRALMIDAQGAVVSAATVAHAPFSSPRTGWAEQNPADWWRASAEAITKVLSASNTRVEDIGAVGFSGQMHGAVLLDEGDNVLRPAIIWCDQRTEAQCRTLTEEIGSTRLIELTCNPAVTGFTLPKMLWVRDTEPTVWSQVRTVLLPKDYVRFRLTGERVTDVADASGTLLFNVGKRKWSEEMLAAAEIDGRLLPRVAESPEVVGQVSAMGAAATGLREGTLVVAGAGDQAAGAVGMGVIRPGTTSATIGSSGVVFAATDKPALDPGGRVHAFCHAVPGRWHVMGVTQAAGLSLRWFLDQFGAGFGDGRDLRDSATNYGRLCQEASTVAAGADGLLWAPYLMGERTPHLDPLARGALVGLTAAHTRAHVIRAILEGVAFSLRDTFEIFKEMSVPTETVRLGGGGARSAVWRQIQGNVYGRTVETVNTEEGAAYGAALLAGVGAGAWPTVESACDAVVKVTERLLPERSAVELMDKQYRAFRKLYPALRLITDSLIEGASDQTQEGNYA